MLRKEAFPMTVDRNEPYALYFGTVSRRKGCDRLLGVLPDLFATLPDFRFTFVGKCRNDTNGCGYHDLIRERCSAYSDRLHILPALHHDQLFPYVANARLVVLPSRFDNLPNTCLEAMAFERVVVATEEASFEQLIEHGQNGFLTPQGDDQALAAQIEHAWNLSDSERARIGSHARRSLERLSPERAIGRLVGLFERVVSKGG